MMCCEPAENHGVHMESSGGLSLYLFNGSCSLLSGHAVSLLGLSNVCVCVCIIILTLDKCALTPVLACMALLFEV